MGRYGGFWLRVVAYIIDAIVLQLAGLLLGGLFGFGVGAGAMMFQGNNNNVESASAIGGGVIGLLLSWLYSAIMESSPLQATLGKKALGLVVTSDDGDRISFGRASGRYFAKILSGLILGFGFFMIGWSERKKGLHDIIANTLVYKSRDPQSLVTTTRVFE